MTDELTDTLREIVSRLEARGIPYMLVGSVAALAYGRSRSTQDFDVVIEARAGTLRALLRSLPEERFYAAEEAAMEALEYETQFNVIDMTTGWKVDLIPRKQRPFSEAEFARRRRLEVLGVDMFVATLEDTIVAKLEWAQAGGGSQRQLEDVHELVKLGGR
ncbi:MAG TPA: nucleotidyltransferase, partial [Enhygromyxa sp.]|nr:nucleotidyltransferase [Enhygromyxa sp.]